MTPAHYYNEWDAYCAAWLRNLIAAKLIPAGDVDERDIRTVQPDDVRGYVQCHFFAGIAGWPLALKMAGWPDERELWTGSCPCQPFSVAGFQAGFEDERHLWPDWLRLIAERRPSTIFGEQVAAASAWLHLVRSDLEALGFAVGAIPIEAASTGAEHFRDRYWFVADLPGQREYGREDSAGTSRRRGVEDDGVVVVAHDDEQCAGSELQRGRQFSGTSSATKDHSRSLDNLTFNGWSEGWAEHEFRSRGFTATVASIDNRQYVECPDGKWRRLPPPRVRWLGTKLPARVAKLRALGNAIDSRPAAAFVTAFMECRP